MCVCVCACAQKHKQNTFLFVSYIIIVISGLRWTHIVTDIGNWPARFIENFDTENNVMCHFSMRAHTPRTHTQLTFEM